MAGRSSPSIIQSLDRLVENRYESAAQVVAEFRRLEPGADDSAIVDRIVTKYSRELGAVAAISGGAAAVPGVGTAAGLAAASADVAWTMTRLGEMVLAIGIAHGHDAASFAERKAWVLSVLSMGRGAVTGVDGLAGRVGSRGGARLAAAISATQLDGVNSKLATKLVARLTTEQAALRLGRVLPFGIGAGIGATGNVLIVRSMARAARQFFADTPPVIEATATEVVPDR